MRCVSCATLLPSNAKFCLECGARQVRGVVGEHRQLMVMFIDLVDSTRLSERLDPEQLRDVVRAYQTTVAESVETHGGTIAQYLGDGVLAYFGFPITHEDYARRGVRAALEILARKESLNERLARESGVRLQLRIGAHTGSVVVADLGSGPRHERLAIGVTVNIASRLGDHARPDTVAISEDTHRLVAPYFACEALGSLDLKGVSQPVAAHRVIREREEGEEQIQHAGGFFGRRRELDVVYERLDRARSGEPQVVVLSGEAGIGKSRLIQALRERCEGEEISWFEGRCSEFHEGSALHPLIQMLRRELGVRHDDPDAAYARISRRLSPLFRDDELALPLLAMLLSLPVRSPLATRDLSPAKVRSETSRVLGDLILQLATDRPVALVIEDLQWVDPSTFEILEDLIGRAGHARLFVLVSRRTGVSLPWQPSVALTELELGRLERQDLESVVALQCRGGRLAGDVRDRILSKADGVPLFAEELTRMVLESGLVRLEGDSYRTVAPLSALGIPSTLQGSLMARLDRLEQGKPVAQVAATIGRSFSVDLLERVAEVPRGQLLEGLSQLLDADLVRRIGEDPREELVFKHALVQDVAYQSLLRSDRRRIHGRICDALTSERAEIAPELIAHHQTEAGRVVEAIPLWQRAGQRALGQSAAAEAVSHLNRALELTLTLPESPERDAAELGLRLAIGNAYITTLGYAATPVEREFARATDLCHRSDDTPRLFAAANGLWGYHLVRGNGELTDRLIARQQDLARRSGRDNHVLLTAHAEGVTAFYAGDFPRARERLTHAASLWDDAQTARPKGDDSRPWRTPATTAPLYLGWCEHLTGHPTVGLERQREALLQAEKRGDAYGHVEAMTHVVALLHDRREPERTLELSDRIVATAERLGFRFWLGIGRSARGWARCHLGELDGGLAEIREGLDIFIATGSMVPLVYRFSYLVEALLLSGRCAEGLAAADEALTKSRGHLDRFYDAEMIRLRGRLQLRLGAPSSEVEADFRQAMRIAREQGALLLELRAAVSLAQLLRQAPRWEEARAELALLRSRFEDEAEIPDLAEADAASGRDA